MISRKIRSLNMKKIIGISIKNVAAPGHRPSKCKQGVSNVLPHLIVKAHPQNYKAASQ